MNTRWTRALVVTVVALLAMSLVGASSCDRRKETKKIQDLSDELCETANDFNKLVIWHHYAPVSLMIVPNRRIDFLMETEKYGGSVQIENFAVVVCQVDENPPPPSDLDLPGTNLPEEGAAPTPTPAPGDAERDLMPKEEAVRAVQDAKIPSTDKSLADTGIDRKKGGKPSKNKVYYGTVLVRYINRNLVPSASVDTILVKQRWINVGEVWYCDFEWRDVVKR